jgi:hypothetical protein
MKTIVIYPGRFHPFHKGHKASYDFLSKKFGAGNVYVVSSDVTAPMTSPFTFSDKMDMMTKLGIPAGRIAQVKHPYRADEIVKEVQDPEDTALVFAVSEKDMDPSGPRFKFGTKKDGSPTYMQPMPEDPADMKPMTQHAYVFITPTVNFKVRGADANSASQIRQMYIDGNDNDRMGIIADLYGKPDPALKDIFDQRLETTEKISEMVNFAKRYHIGRDQRRRLSSIMESVMEAENVASRTHQSLQEDVIPSYFREI